MVQKMLTGLRFPLASLFMYRGPRISIVLTRYRTIESYNDQQAKMLLKMMCWETIIFPSWFSALLKTTSVIRASFDLSSASAFHRGWRPKSYYLVMGDVLLLLSCKIQWLAFLEAFQTFSKNQRACVQIVRVTFYLTTKFQPRPN